MRLEWGWDSRPHEQGVDQVVLYSGDQAVVWNGITAIEEKPNGALDTSLYLDGVRLSVVEESEEFEATLSAFTYPELFEQHDGFADTAPDQRFSLSYRTQTEKGYRLHLLYDALAIPTGKAYTTINAAASGSAFSWDIHANVKDVPGARPSAHLVLESDGYFAAFSALEDVLYGTDTTDPRLPDPVDVVELFENASMMRVQVNADGTWTAEGPDEWVKLNGDGSFTITAPSAYLIDNGRFVLNSY